MVPSQIRIKSKVQNRRQQIRGKYEDLAQIIETKINANYVYKTRWKTKQKATVSHGAKGRVQGYGQQTLNGTASEYIATDGTKQSNSNHAKGGVEETGN